MLRQDLDCMDWILTHGSRPKCPSWSASLEPHTLEKTKGQKAKRQEEKKTKRKEEKKTKGQKQKDENAKR